ncbi:aminoglycoside phosphotransferase family protein [Leptolyngbya sp. BC1307]|uniref:phosphotransferase enzyme family protein n=1 Tax=Leptolyngbya sp. BC1307 TaxID=2029589 RepID=UPI000EFC6990|nr:aminoglycoside phosphotransferase family protein [Leptolyngbya sp. BC1307]
MPKVPAAALVSDKHPTGSAESLLWAIAERFVRSGQVSDIRPLGNGNINSTFLVTVFLPSRSESRFVLQRINAQVFRQPELVIQNMAVLSEHLRCQPTDLPRRWETPHILPTQQGEHFWLESGEYWRAISFIEDSHVLETVESLAHAEEVGYGLAMFHRLISTLPVDRLADTLEGFHITPAYLDHYAQVLTERCTDGKTTATDADSNAALTDALDSLQAEQVHYCLAFVEQRQDWAHVLERAKAAGHLQLRPIHGDPKINNIMLGENGQAVSLIDLDTLKPGLLHYDIGDCLRSGCNPLGEETEDWENVVFDVELARAMLRGYLVQAKDFLSESDYLYLYDAIRLLAFELGLRFFTDYLEGNVYFKVKHPTHNLIRALVQFKLTESIEAQEETLRAMIQSLR